MRKEGNAFFTLQSQLLTKLYDYLPREAVDILLDSLANCAAQLEHRGPVIFDQPPQFNFWAKAKANWVNVAGNKSYVDCYLCGDRDGGNTTSTTLRVYLPRNTSVAAAAIGGKDPNIRSGAVLAYLKDKAGIAVCITDYLDAKIGTIVAWDGTDAEVPPGWQLLRTINGVSIWDAAAAEPRLLLPYLDPTFFVGAEYVPFQTAGAVGGNRSHSHAGHTIDSHVLSSVVVTGTTSSEEADGAITYTDPAITTTIACATTGIQVVIDDHESHAHGKGILDAIGYTSTGPRIEVASAGCTTEPLTPGSGIACGGPADADVFKHDVFVNEPACSGSGSATAYGHKHTASSDQEEHAHDFVAVAHSHALICSAHSHTVNDHAPLSHDSAEHLDPFIVTKWIKRID